MPTKSISYENLALFKQQYDALVERLLREKFVPISEEEFNNLDIKQEGTLYIVY